MKVMELMNPNQERYGMNNKLSYLHRKLLNTIEYNKHIFLKLKTGTVNITHKFITVSISYILLIKLRSMKLTKRTHVTAWFSKELQPKLLF